MSALSLLSPIPARDAAARDACACLSQTGARGALFGLTLLALLAGCQAAPGPADAGEATPQTTSVRTAPAAPSSGAPAGSAEGLQARVYRVIERVLPSVVMLRVESGAGISHGAGVLISQEGHFLTNDHVVDGARDIEALLTNYETYQAKVVGRDPLSDLAVLKVSGAKNLTPIAYGDSDALSVGQFVIAFGNPFGISFRDAQPTATFGMIGALDRVTLPADGLSLRLYRGAIQHDAAINPGNSGGPLVDLEGRLIGINGVISSPSGTSSGVSFAIPVNTIRTLLPDLLAGRRPRHAWLGIGGFVNVVQPTADGVGPGRRGVLVRQIVEPSPAASGGLRPGDIIIKADALNIRGRDELLNWLGEIDAGSTHTLVVFRPTRPWAGTGTRHTFTLTVGSR